MDGQREPLCRSRRASTTCGPGTHLDLALAEPGTLRYGFTRLSTRAARSCPERLPAAAFPTAVAGCAAQPRTSVRPTPADRQRGAAAHRPARLRRRLRSCTSGRSSSTPRCSSRNCSAPAGGSARPRHGWTTSTTRPSSRSPVTRESSGTGGSCRCGRWTCPHSPRSSPARRRSPPTTTSPSTPTPSPACA